MKYLFFIFFLFSSIDAMELSARKRVRFQEQNMPESHPRVMENVFNSTAQELQKDWLEQAGEFCCNEDCSCCPPPIGCLLIPVVGSLGAAFVDCIQACRCVTELGVIDGNCISNAVPATIGAIAAGTGTALFACLSGCYSQVKKLERARSAAE